MLGSGTLEAIGDKFFDAAAMPIKAIAKRLGTSKASKVISDSLRNTIKKKLIKIE